MPAGETLGAPRVGATVGRDLRGNAEGETLRAFRYEAASSVINAHP
jgi:hypothetical protein